MSPFGTELMAKAHRIERLAMEKRKEEIVAERDHQSKPRSATMQLPSYTWIPGAFERFVQMPDPDGLGSIASTMRHAQKLLDGTVMESIDIVEKYVLDWRGEAGSTFAEKFTAPFPKIVDHQVALAGILGAAMDATREIYNRARDNINQIADDTITSLEALPCSDAEARLALTVLWAVVGVASAAAGAITGGAALGIAFAIVASAGPIVTESLPESAASPVGGNCVDEVLKNMADTINELEKAIHSEEQKVIRALQKNYDLITDRSNRPEIVARRPELADADARYVKAQLKPRV